MGRAGRVWCGEKGSTSQHFEIGGLVVLEHVGAKVPARRLVEHRIGDSEKLVWASGEEVAYERT